jgi:hypothetical protein
MQQVVRAPLHLVEGKRIRGREPEAHFDLGKQLNFSVVGASCPPFSTASKNK